MNLFKFFKSYFFDQFTLHFGGGGGGPTQTTSTVQNTNIPAYAEPYVNTMLGATQRQLFQGTQDPSTTNPETGEVTPGAFNITGFKPYQAYGGTYDALGNQTSYDPSKGIAGFQKLQSDAQAGVGRMALPGEYDQASNATRRAMQNLQRANYQGSYFGNQFQDPGQFQPGQFNAQQAYAPELRQFQMRGPADVRSQGYDAATMGAAQTGYNPQLQAFQMGPAERVQSQSVGTPLMSAAQSGFSSRGLQDFQMGPAERIETQSFAQPGSADAYMSPYMQNVVNIQQREAQRQADIAKTQSNAQAVRAGAFGGSRQAIMDAEAARNLAIQKGDIQATGLQSAFQQAQGQFNTEQQARLAAQQANQQAGLTVGQQNLGARQATQQLGFGADLQTSLANLNASQQANVQNQAAQLQSQGLNAQQAMQAALANQQAGLTVGQQNLASQQATQQLGTQTGMQTALANLSNQQQANVQNQAARNQAMGMNAQQAMQAALANQQSGLTTGQQNLAAKLGIQQLGSGQNLQAQLANQQFGMTAQQLAEQSRQFGAGQNMTAAQQRAQYGLAGQQAAEQSRQFGANYGIQANQAALGAANQLAGIGGQRLQGQQGIYNLQNQFGAQQQALEQQKLNQAMQDYANAQQYPLMQLGTMSNMLRGLPMQASSTQQYQAAPNQLSQAIGTIGSGASIYNAFNPRPPGGAAGGLPKEFKYAKGGGIMSYDMGGEVEEQLESMDEKGLENQAKTSSSPSIRRMAQRILRERQMSKQPQGASAMGVQYQAPAVPGMRGGGIIAFQQGAGGNGVKSAIEEGGDEEARIGMKERLAMPPTTDGIMGAAPAAAPAPYAPQPNRAMQQAADIPAFMKADYADAERRANAPLSDFMAERRAAMQEAGVADISEGQQKQRAELMAEKANMGEEKERQKHLRLAEFFAKWGSTPGPTLVAGMNALRESVPGIISDEKEQKKARREIDKSIADLDNATRLEKRGEVDAAMALKLKAADDMKALNLKFIDYQSRRDSDAASAAASKYSADMQFRSEQLRATTARLDRLANRETANDNKVYGQYQAAAQQEQRVIAKIIDQAKLLEKDYATINTAEMNAKQNDGKMNPMLVPGYEAAKKKIEEQEKIWTKQKEDAARDTELAYGRVRLKPEPVTPPGANKPSPATSGPISGDFQAPTAAHITALKKNPEQAAAFDAKFGPGAANEYLGK
jgi:hypothetical protein